MNKHHCLCYLGGLFLLLGGLAGTALAADLIYVPVEPCRIADTRATIGAIPADSSVSLIAYGGVGELTGQGGSAGGCPNPKPGSTPVSIAANVTAVGNQATGNGNLVAYPFGSTDPGASLVNYKQGTNIANSSIIALCEGDICTYDFDLKSNFSAVPAIVDVQGYFYPKTMKNVITVSAENADFTNPIDAINAIPTTGPDVPSATNPYLIEIGPGTYDLGSNQLIMRDWVDIKGTGSREATVITGAVSGTLYDSSALVVGADNTELTDLSINHTGVSAISIGIYNDGTSSKIQRVNVRASGGTSQNIGIYNNGYVTLVMSNVNARGSNGNQNFGVFNYAGPSVSMKEVTAQASGGTECYGVYNAGSSSTMINVVARASGGSGQNWGVYLGGNFNSTDIQFSTLEGGTGGGGLWTGGNIVKVKSSTLYGGAGGTTSNNSCIYVADEDNNPLDVNCLPIP